LDILIYGIISSASLLLTAFGFSLVYGISRLPNFAHGAIYIFTGYIAWLLYHQLSVPYVPAGILAVVCATILGGLIYIVVVKRVRGMEMSEVIATYAVGLAILEGLRWSGLRGSTFTLPLLVEGSLEIGGVPVDYHRILVVAVAAGVMIVLWLFTHYTRMGLALRGVAQDERAAMTLGINSDLAATIAVALGSALAGIAGLMILPLGNIVVQEGYNVLIYAVAVCVVGGLGSWSGTVLAAVVLGFSQYIAVYLDRPHYQMVVMLIAIILTLIVRPSGFFGKQKELEERV
jgi:branched-chain amino acid transport system permease protein